jgi:hypothetical protein
MAIGWRSAGTAGAYFRPRGVELAASYEAGGLRSAAHGAGVKPVQLG